MERIKAIKPFSLIAFCNLYRDYLYRDIVLKENIQWAYQYIYLEFYGMFNTV